MSFPSKTNRQTILSTAIDQVANDGINKLALRSVAAALGVAPNALYRYFASLAALKEALAEESRHRLLEVLMKAARGKKTPDESIRSIALAYVRFAREQPKVFALTLLPAAADTDANAAHMRSWHFVVGQVARIYGDERAPEAATALWAFLHGITILEAAGVFGERKPASSLEFGLRIWVEGAVQGDTS